MASIGIDRQSSLTALLQQNAGMQSPQLRKASTLGFRLCAVWVGLNIIDAIVTYTVLQGGGMEINPVARLIIKHLQLGPALITKIALATPVAILIVRWKPGLLLSLNIMMTCVVVLSGASVLLSHVISL